MALLGSALADVREVMIEGPSGLRTIAPRAVRPVFEIGRRRLVWPNGAVAQVFSAEDPIGSREVGRRCALNRTRANRLLGTWRHLGMLEQDDEARYRPGPGVHVLAGLGMQASGLLRAALPTAEAWVERGYALSLAVRWQDRLAFLLSVRPGQSLLEGIGHRGAPQAVRSSAGLAMLACEDPQRVAAWGCPTQWAERGDGGDLAAVLATARERGYATRGYADGTRSIGVALDPAGTSALAVSRHDLQRRELRGLGAELRAARDAIAERAAAGGGAALDDIDDDAIPA